MSKSTDIRCIGARLYFLPVHMRMPLKFGTETVSFVTCARARLTIRDRAGHVAEGWGETPLSVTWVWPSPLPYEERLHAMRLLCQNLTEAWARWDRFGHPLELGTDFNTEKLEPLRQQLNAARGQTAEPMPWLAALVCNSVFDQALHDAYGRLLGCDTYLTYTPQHLNRNLADLGLEPASRGVTIQGHYPADYLVSRPLTRLRAWHLVGGVDPLDSSERNGREPDDGYPVLLADWIRADGLKCLKIKLRGDDAAWDYARVIKVGSIALAHSVDWLTADFNCTVRDPAYVNDIIDRLRDEHPRLHGMVLYIEQPFPYDLEAHAIDVRSVSARKPLFLDESAHDWRHVRLGRELGWTGVALKTCKTMSGALLAACWAKAHGMTLMVQDLTNPMLALVPHVRLAAHVSTIMGVETNASQFYPTASAPEAAVHPGLYQRRDGCVDFSSLGGSGFGYRWHEIQRSLPEPAKVCEDDTEHLRVVNKIRIYFY